MKNIKSYFIYILVSTFSSSIYSQDSLRLEDMLSYASSFIITNGDMHGKGAEVLTKAIGDAHITLLGDDHRSALEHEFTEALIKEIVRNEYTHLVLEVGAASIDIAKQVSTKNTQSTSSLKELNGKYSFERTGGIFTPIPEFKSIEAAKYLQQAKDLDLSITSIGIESWTGYKMLVDQLFNNLSLENQLATRESYQKVIHFLKEQYNQVSNQNFNDLLQFTTALKTSTLFQEFLEEMATHNSNSAIIEEMNFSIDYWRMYGNKEFYKKNKLYAKRNKTQLSSILKGKKFDFQKDKLLLKMYRNHLAKGTTVNGFYGVGNMLQELTEYHGNNCLSIALVRRFHEHEGTIKDNAESDNFDPFKDFIPLGNKETWTLIDLRSFTEKFYYSPIFLSPAIQKIINRYDLLVIPKMDRKAVLNVEIVEEKE